ncbi:hypothetical protein [Clostridium sp. Marseille-Q2269]|uniref:hypothetical protein n=1 Tax=Clostridium sp. Marseille-Q2269 TaxID=2942205 RepID=UPI002073EBF2|nr:hypothetical protein [Clostridium sp. Marseille-Q2269]
MFYNVEKKVSSIYNKEELQIVGYIDVFLDEDKTQKLTTISFNELGIYLAFKDCPKDKEIFNKFIEDKALEEINKEEIQNKIQEVKLAYDMGLIELNNL